MVERLTPDPDALGASVRTVEEVFRDDEASDGVPVGAGDEREGEDAPFVYAGEPVAVDADLVQPVEDPEARPDLAQVRYYNPIDGKHSYAFRELGISPKEPAEVLKGIARYRTLREQRFAAAYIGPLVDRSTAGYAASLDAMPWVPEAERDADLVRLKVMFGNTYLERVKVDAFSFRSDVRMRLQRGEVIDPLAVYREYLDVLTLGELGKTDAGRKFIETQVRWAAKLLKEGIIREPLFKDPDYVAPVSKHGVRLPTADDMRRKREDLMAFLGDIGALVPGDMVRMHVDMRPFAWKTSYDPRTGAPTTQNLDGVRYDILEYNSFSISWPRFVESRERSAAIDEQLAALDWPAWYTPGAPLPPEEDQEKS